MPGQAHVTVVVGYDGSESARHGLTRVQSWGVQGISLVVVAVTPTVASPGLGVELAGEQPTSEAALDEARALLQAGDQVLTIDTRTATGDPAEVLMQTARDVNADLLVVGRRGRDYVTRALLGSVATRVVQHAPCDVLVVG